MQPTSDAPPPADARPQPKPSSTRSTTWGRGLLFRLMVLGMVACLGCVALEVAIRLLFTVTDLPLTFYDPVIGPRISPNQTGRWVTGDFVNAPYHFNAQGWNHSENYVIPRPPSGIRVAVIGDSQVESLQVPQAESFFAVAQRLGSRPDRPAQWYAFGNSGWGTSQELEVLRHYVLDYRPDVAVFVFLQNDPWDCSPYLVRMERYQPCHTLGPAGELRLRLPGYWQPSMKGRIAIRSAAFRFLVAQKHLPDLLLGKGAHRDIGGLPLRAASNIGADDDVPDLGTMSIRDREAKTWQLIAALMMRAKEECASRGTVIAVAFRGWSPEIEQPLGAVFPPPPPKDVDPYCLNERMSEMGREQLGPICERLGIPYLDLTTALKTGVAKTGKSSRFPDDNHLSSAGHASVGEAMAAWVDEILAHAKAADLKSVREN